MTILLFVLLTLVSPVVSEEMYMTLQFRVLCPEDLRQNKCLLWMLFKMIRKYECKYKIIINILLKIKGIEMDSDIEMPHTVSIQIYYKAAENMMV